jgi:hypothetical protein
VTAVATLEHTCEACPSQWEGTLDDGTHFYVRYRGARLRIGFGATLNEAEARGCSDGARPDFEKRRDDVDPLHGYMTWDEVLPYFNEAVQARGAG